VHALNITDGAADTIVRAARDGTTAVLAPATIAPLSDTPYDLVVGDLFYSQLLAPALGDIGLDDHVSIDALAAPPDHSRMRRSVVVPQQRPRCPTLGGRVTRTFPRS